VKCARHFAIFGATNPKTTAHHCTTAISFGFAPLICSDAVLFRVKGRKNEKFDEHVFRRVMVERQPVAGGPVRGGCRSFAGFWLRDLGGWLVAIDARLRPRARPTEPGLSGPAIVICFEARSSRATVG